MEEEREKKGKKRKKRREEGLTKYYVRHLKWEVLEHQRKPPGLSWNDSRVPSCLQNRIWLQRSHPQQLPLVTPIQKAKHLLGASIWLRGPTGPYILTRTLAPEVGEERIGLWPALLVSAQGTGPVLPSLRQRLESVNTC